MDKNFPTVNFTHLEISVNGFSNVHAQRRIQREIWHPEKIKKQKSKSLLEVKMTGKWEVLKVPFPAMQKY